MSPALNEENEAAALAAVLPFFDLQPEVVSEEKQKKKEAKGGKASKPAPGESPEELLELTQQNLRALLLVLLAPKPDADTLVRLVSHSFSFLFFFCNEFSLLLCLLGIVSSFGKLVDICIAETS